MIKLSNIGRIFYGLAIAVMGILTIYYHDFPYMLVPPKHSWIPGLAGLAYISGGLLILAGAGIVFEKGTRLVSLLLGTALLLIFCFCFVPYELISDPNWMHLINWENAEKELALAGGAFLIAGCYETKKESSPGKFLGKLIPLGSILFCIPIISFGILHFMYAKDVSDYVPSWVPYRLFWTYAAGSGLLASGLAIILKIIPGTAATLLGSMILIWFIILHIPRVVDSSAAFMGSEVTSAFIALAYSGIAFVIAGASKKHRVIE